MDIFDDKNWVFEEIDEKEQTISLKKDIINNIENIINEYKYSKQNILENHINNYLTNKNIDYNIIFKGINEIDIYLKFDNDELILNNIIDIRWISKK